MMNPDLRRGFPDRSDPHDPRARPPNAAFGDPGRAAVCDALKDLRALEEAVLRLDGRGYRAYRAVAGSWAFPGFVLHVDHVQGDPYAAPTRVRVALDARAAGLPRAAYATHIRALGTAACLARSFADRARAVSRRRGTGRSGGIEMESPGQEVMEQTAVLVSGNGSVEARFTVGLPAQGRRILAREAAALLIHDVADVVRGTLLAGAHDPAELEAHAATNEDAEHLRGLLPDMGLVAFVADGAVLPRRSGVDDRPLEGGEVVPFRSPEPMRVHVDLPNLGPISGMGVPEGVTLVVGGGFHGKSTLLRALEAGVHNHRPGDGRERVVSLSETAKVRAEDGRSVAGVDISPFIEGLPTKQATDRFSTANASGSTSQAAAIVEALEAGARVLLVDEDTSATNFMIRDRRMQMLVASENEPITPFVDRVRELHTTLGISCVLVLGGSGDYLDVADTVVRMEAFTAHDVTTRAQEIARAHPTGRVVEAASPVVRTSPRVPAPGSVDPARGRQRIQVRAPDARTLLFGTATVDLAGVEQIVSRAQVRTLGLALAWAAEHLIDGARSVPEILDRLQETVAHEGLDAFDPRRPGDMAGFRRLDLAAVLNRLRSLRVR